MKTEVVAVMFTDLVGYTEKTSSQSHEQNAAMLKRLKRVVHPLVKNFGGRVVKEIGDGVLSVFRAVTPAARAAMAIQDRLAEININLPVEERLHLRIALNVGEVRFEGGDIFGEAVNIAARIEAQTPPGEIHLSEAAFLTMNRVGIKFREIGVRELKGIAEPVALYSIPAAPEPTESRTDTLPYLGRYLAELRRVLWRRRIKVIGVAFATALLLGTISNLLVVRFWERGDRAAVRAAVANGALIAAAEGLAALHKTGVDTEKELNGLFAHLAAVPDAQAGCIALDRLDFANRETLARLRLAQAFGLLEKGELAQARACLASVDPEVLITNRRLFELSMIHLDSLEALNHHRAIALKKTLRRYEGFLRAGTAPASHLALIASIAARGYLYRASRPVADSLVVEFLGDQAIAAMVEIAADPETAPTSRAWIIARLEETAGAEAPVVDWVRVYAAVLSPEVASTCGMRRAAVVGLKRLNNLAVVGILAREAARRDRCTRDLARQAADGLVATGTLTLERDGHGPVVVASR